jgi:hypothetical protein
MSFNLADKPLAERAALEDEKSRLFDLWQSNLGKAKGDAARLFGERAKRKGQVGRVGSCRAGRHVATGVLEHGAQRSQSPDGLPANNDYAKLATIACAIANQP